MMLLVPFLSIHHCCLCCRHRPQMGGVYCFTALHLYHRPMQAVASTKGLALHFLT